MKYKPEDFAIALRAANGNHKKAEDILYIYDTVGFSDEVSSIYLQRVASYGQKYPRRGAKRIVEDALKPHMQAFIDVSLFGEDGDALKKAAKKLKRYQRDIVYEVLTDWLKKEGFYDE